MYCPKCGAQNQDALAYCRECGENLQVISQVMKKHLPVALISKFDAVIEQKHERFRRDAILGVLMGTVVLISTILAPLGKGFFTLLNISMFLLGIFAFFSGGWYFLAYRRSLELKTKPSDILSGKSLSGDILKVDELSDSTGTATNKLNHLGIIYCPRCGVQNSVDVLYCRACGTNLDFSIRPQGVEKIFPTFLVKKLDAEIAKNERTGYKPQYNSGWTLLAVSLIFLFNVIMQGSTGSWGLAAIYLILGLGLVITGSWNLAAHRRGLTKNKEYLDNVSALAGSKFAQQDTLPVSSPPLSVTEATTKPLVTKVGQIGTEEIPTSPIPDNSRR